MTTRRARLAPYMATRAPQARPVWQLTPLPVPQVFEDETSGEVRLPLDSLGPERRVYLGKSVEGVLRYRKAAELRVLFRESYVCIRRCVAPPATTARKERM